VKLGRKKDERRDKFFRGPGRSEHQKCGEINQRKRREGPISHPASMVGKVQSMVLHMDRGFVMETRKKKNNGTRNSQLDKDGNSDRQWRHNIMRRCLG